MANSDSTFKITYKEALGEYSVKNTAGTVLDEELCKKYDDNAIAKAKQLKAKHGTEHSDDFYLKIGKSLVLQELIGANTEIYKNRLAGCDIKDMEWAVYSYEEILAMETEGYKIPEEVLQWAHSQQEADVTDYVMVSDATANEDNVTDAMGTSSNELDNLKKKAKQSIAKTDKALEEAAQDIEKYNEIAAKAKKIKEEKEDNYKDTMNKISSKTEEWKQLDEKKKSGKLSRSEERKYKHLSKELNSSNGTIMKEVQLNHAELDSFLETLGDLNVDISDNLTLAQNTIKAGKELGEYEKSYPSAHLPQATSGIIFDGNGKSSDSLYDVKGNEEISEIAIEKGTELNATSNDTLAEITNKENTELSQFANEYTQLATKIENETENAMGEQNNSENKAENEEKKQNKPIDYKVAKNISYQNAILATATTLASTTDLLSRDNGVDKNDKRLQQELKKTQKDSTELTKETTTSETKLEQTQTQENEFLAQLQSIQDSKKDETKPEEKTETTTQQQSLVSQISEKQDESKSLKDLVKKAKASEMEVGQVKNSTMNVESLKDSNSNILYIGYVDTSNETLEKHLDSHFENLKQLKQKRKEKRKEREQRALFKNCTILYNTTVENENYPKASNSKDSTKIELTIVQNLDGSKTDFSKTDSVVVVNKGQYKKTPNRTLTDFEEIQLNENLTTSEKIKEIYKIKNIGLKEMALLEKFIDSTIFISDAQFNMLKTFDYKIADLSLNTTIAQGGETFSYFNKVYIQKEKEDIEDFTDDFMPLHNVNVEYENKIENTEDLIFIPSLENEESSFDCKAEAYKRCEKFNWDMDTTTVKLSYKDAVEYAIANNLEYPKL